MRVVKIQQSSGSKNAIREFVERLKEQVSRNGYVNGLPRMYVRVLAGHYWDDMSIPERQTYLKNQIKVTADSEKDPHIGDDNFQNKVIGGVAKYQMVMSQLMSKTYLENKIFEYPNKLNGMIETSKGNFNYGLLLDNTATYLCVPNDEESRIRRYKKLTFVLNVNPQLDEDEAAEDEVES